MAPGRKRKPGKRYACGKRTRQETERDAMSVAIDARRRHFGVTAKQAKDERLGTALGRLAWIDGPLPGEADRVRWRHAAP